MENLYTSYRIFHDNNLNAEIILYISIFIRICDIFLMKELDNMGISLKIKMCFWYTINAREENGPSMLSQQRVFMEESHFVRATIGTDNAIAREDEWTINRGSTWFVWGITTLNGAACLYRHALTGSLELP